MQQRYPGARTNRLPPVRVEVPRAHASTHGARLRRIVSPGAGPRANRVEYLGKISRRGSRRHRKRLRAVIGARDGTPASNRGLTVDVPRAVEGLTGQNRREERRDERGGAPCASNSRRDVVAEYPNRTAASAPARPSPGFSNRSDARICTPRYSPSSWLVRTRPSAVPFSDPAREISTISSAEGAVGDAALRTGPRPPSSSPRSRFSARDTAWPPAAMIARRPAGGWPTLTRHRVTWDAGARRDTASAAADAQSSRTSVRWYAAYSFASEKPAGIDDEWIPPRRGRGGVVRRAAAATVVAADLRHALLRATKCERRERFCHARRHGEIGRGGGERMRTSRRRGNGRRRRWRRRCGFALGNLLGNLLELGRGRLWCFLGRRRRARPRPRVSHLVDDWSRLRGLRGRLLEGNWRRRGVGECRLWLVSLRRGDPNGLFFGLVLRDDDPRVGVRRRLRRRRRRGRLRLVR